ncbi:1-acyl-sn-glycerol-3-phosphate acyltransferase [Paraconexibacter antarcticus]|uniref:1-acyl-sn-glycerol-3-phosphate acyltransferase n=1 Tax=Paraconexibacter antarcticus TaxID=2949664 RepID=A0ABY5DWN2_9ACTN|nr:lysophospholipid acyltransferase family protein [Paraconexibacter antarcticus]UTI65683.1 1-acyl-sn-glycerol-3-phosphate acyltransferase [Paraconexibacter antarcticus]
MAPDEKLVKMKDQVYKDTRPQEFFDRYHARARNEKPNWVYELVRIATSLYSYTLLRARSIGTHNIPQSGPIIIAPNHFSFMDHFLCGAFTRRKLRFMAKSQLFAPPMVWIYSPGGVFPVRRGVRDEDAFITAKKILADGGAVCMYCEGGRSRTGQLADTAKPGIGRLALESGATIVPVAIHGSAKVRNWKRLQFPKITVQYGEPFRYEQVAGETTRPQQQAVADEIFTAIKELYGRLDVEGAGAVARTVREERRARRRVRGAAHV